MNNEQIRIRSLFLRYQKEKRSLIKQLEETDYKVIKNYEYFLVGLEAPYDVTILHEERQSIRDRINELDELINDLL